MVERVARALFNSEQEAFPVRVRRKPFDDMDEVSGVAARYRFLARAAIAAMSEPTESMMDALRDQEDSNFLNSKALDPEWAWRAMIDAALK